ncbi:MAG: hypothetical protein ACI9OJ_000322 [Myxococcota bacterium]|jgi:hypothetical protein
MNAVKTLIIFNCLALAAVGCSSDDTETDGHSHGAHDHGDAASGDTFDHTACTGHETAYSAGLEATSANGKFKLTLDEAKDLQVGDVTLEVRLVDENDAPLENAEFTTDTTTWQHIHLHTGTSSGGEVTAGSAGKYTIAKMTVLHKGSWEFWIDLKFGDTTDRATFHFCVPETAE